MNTAMRTSVAWYREPWPWLLMSGPLFVIIAGGFTAWLAFANEDGLVEEDYYKQGLAINQVIKRDAEAVALGIKAQVMFGERGVRVRVSGARPAELQLALVHPTRAGQDRKLTLVAEGDGWYAAVLDMPAGRWHLVLQDGAGTWRVGRTVDIHAGATVALDARSMAGPGG